MYDSIIFVWLSFAVYFFAWLIANGQCAIPIMIHIVTGAHLFQCLHNLGEGVREVPVLNFEGSFIPRFGFDAMQCGSLGLDGGHEECEIIWTILNHPSVVRQKWVHFERIPFVPCVQDIHSNLLRCSLDSSYFFIIHGLSKIIIRDVSQVTLANKQG